MAHILHFPRCLVVSFHGDCRVEHEVSTDAQRVILNRAAYDHVAQAMACDDYRPDRQTDFVLFGP